MRRSIGLLAGIGLLLASGSALLAQDAPQYHELKKIAVGGDGGWDYLMCDGAAHRLYIARSNRVMVVDVEKGEVVGEIPNTPGVHGIALAPRLHRGFISDGGENTVTVFDTDTLKEVDRVKVGTRPDCIIFDRASNRVFTFNGGSNDSTAIDAASAKVVGTVALEGRPEFAVADGRGHIFCNLEDKSEIASFDAKTLTVSSHWSLAPGEGPSGLSMDRRNHRLFSVCDNEKMVVMDADTGKVVATPTIGKGPDACAFDPQAGLAFSSNGQDGTLTLVKEEAPDKFSVAATVPTQRGARTMALDTQTHNIYLVTARFGPPPPSDNGERRRPSIEPNSFVILVYGK
jgi:YVTN family beta-propeller protein